MDCLFCKIAAGEIPSTKIYEDAWVYAFADIDPKAPFHAIVIPREHIASAAEITAENSGLIAKVFEAIAKIAEQENLTSLEEFDKKHSIHYRCAEWLGRLLELLKDAGDQERYDEVRNWIQTMREED